MASGHYKDAKPPLNNFKVSVGWKFFFSSTGSFLYVSEFGGMLLGYSSSPPKILFCLPHSDTGIHREDSLDQPTGRAEDAKMCFQLSEGPLHPWEAYVTAARHPSPSRVFPFRLKLPNRRGAPGGLNTILMPHRPHPNPHQVMCYQCQPGQAEVTRASLYL